MVSRLALCVLLCLLVPLPVQARGFRARFRPETLELQKPGELAMGLQAGGLYGDGVDGSRIILPDFKLDLGVLRWLAFGIDGAFSVTQVGGTKVGVGGDPLWTSARLELFNLESPEGKKFGMGLQVGPRFRTVDNARGVGLGALLLVGGGTKRLRAVANLGAFLDREQAYALAFGGSIQWDFERRRKWTLEGQLAGAHYFGDTQGDADPDQIFLLTGCGTELSETLQLSLLLLTGPFARGDRIGLLASVTWDHKLW